VGYHIFGLSAIIFCAPDDAEYFPRIHTSALDTSNADRSTPRIATEWRGDIIA
jgi:hypothetical protein